MPFFIALPPQNALFFWGGGAYPEVSLIVDFNTPNLSGSKDGGSDPSIIMVAMSCSPNHLPGGSQ